MKTEPVRPGCEKGSPTSLEQPATSSASAPAPGGYDLRLDPEVVDYLTKLDEQDMARKHKLAEEAEAARVAVLNRGLPEPGRPDTGRITPSFPSDIGDLPGTPGEVLERLKLPHSPDDAQALLDKLGELYCRDLVEDLSHHDPAELHPLAFESCMNLGPIASRQLVMHVLPLRRSLARFYSAQTPDVCMMLDLLALAYFRALRAEGEILTSLASADRDALQRMRALQAIHDAAVRQVATTVESLRLLTGKTASFGPRDGMPALHRFSGSPVTGSPEALQKRRRDGTRG